jgi:23S rRNA pseudouridine1911/1915/1917 synthase
MPESLPISISATTDAAGMRLDQFLVSHLPETSRARVQQLIAAQQVLVNHVPAKPSLKLRGNETISLLGPVQLPPLRAIAEEIPLDVVYEDDDLAVINKPAGMMVHVGAGATEAARNRGTLVNALLHRFSQLSSSSGEFRPGIVHRLDKETSGLLVVAKNDAAHRKLAAQFASRQVKKNYIALVHGWLKQDHGTISAPISRDLVRRIRMTTRRADGRSAITHYTVSRKVDSHTGKFTLLDLLIETGRTHQIRVHLASIGHPVVGDSLYGAPKTIGTFSLKRNFLHAASLQFTHPRTGERMSFSRPLPEELSHLLDQL